MPSEPGSWACCSRGLSTFPPGWRARRTASAAFLSFDFSTYSCDFPYAFQARILGRMKGLRQMTDFRTIEIDFEIHKLIESERLSFAESPNDVLRRLLNLRRREPKNSVNTLEKSWSNLGVELRHGSRLRMSYNGATYTGFIDNGAWVVEGRHFTSPSGAASGVARTKKGKATRLDGWRYWEVQLPGTDTWVTLWHLWEQAEADKKRQK